MTGADRYEVAQTIAAAQQTQARQNVYAAPFDALAYNGIQVNGSMDVSQQHGTTAVTTANTYVIDGWECSFGATIIALSAAQVADAPPGYKNSLKITVTTAKATLAAGDYAALSTPIEDVRMTRLAFGTASAQPVSIGFWSKIHRTGTYGGSLQNALGTRCYPFSFTQNISNTWEYKTVTIPGDTLAGVSWSANSTGFWLNFAMAAGSASLGPANAWATTSTAAYIGVTGMINGVAALTDTFQITGVVLLPGIELPSASRAPLIMRPYDQELMLCRRYLQVVGAFAMPYQGTGDQIFSYWLSPQMLGGPRVDISLFTDANYNSNGTPALNQWSFLKQNVAWAVKTGTVTTALITNWTSMVQIQFRGATWSVPPDNLALGTGNQMLIDARM
jgi:hypothetical protein